LVVVVLGCALGTGDVAMAQIDDDPPYTERVDASLTVTKPPTGLVSGGPINCGGAANACSADLDYDRTCFPTPGPLPDQCDEGTPSTVTLTASGGQPGFEPQWTGCDSVDASQRCVITVSGHETVSLAWRDAVAPTVGFVNPPSRAKGSTIFTASATDAQTQITHVEFTLPGIVFDADQTAPYTFRPQEGGDYFEHGQSYTVTVRARDAAGNTSTASHTFAFDSSAALDSITTAPALTRCDNPFVDEPDCDQRHVAAPPSFTFDPAADTSSIGCLTEEVGTQVFEVEDFEQGMPSLSCTPSVPADTPGQPTYDGAYRTHVFVNDGLNTESYVYEWTLDRRGPSINLFSPADGSYVKAPFTLNITGSDLTPPFEYTCDLGGGFGPCTGTFDPPEGPKTLRVRSVDALGNTRSLERSFVYDKTAPRVEITSGPAEGALIRTRSVTFGFNASDAVGPITRECKVDQGAFGPCAAGDSHSIDNLNPGIHRFTLRVVDAAGHETQVERLFVTDDPPPTNNAGDTGGGAGAGGGNTTPGTAPGTTPGTSANPGTTPGTGAPGGETEVPRPLVASARSSRKFSVSGGRTRIRKLVLSGLARGTTIEVKCRGRGCFRGTSKFTARRGKLSLTSLFKKRTLAARSVIEIRVAQSGRTTKVFRYTTQKGRKQPKAQTLCLPAGASKPGACR
jgi:hypothetical protein